MSDNKKSSISKRSSCYLLNLKQPTSTAKRLKLSFQRTSATVTITKFDRTVEASVGFLDVSETGAGVFTPELLNKGSAVELCITEPVILKVRGIVAWSAPISSGVHQGKFKCRSGIQFALDGEAQLASLKEFVKRAQSDPLESMRGMNSPSPADALPATALAEASAAPTVPVAEPASAAPAEAPVIAAEVAPVPLVDSPAAAVVEPAPLVAAPVADSGGTPDSGQQAA